MHGVSGIDVNHSVHCCYQSRHMNNPLSDPPRPGARPRIFFPSLREVDLAWGVGPFISKRIPDTNVFTDSSPRREEFHGENMGRPATG